MCGYIGKVSLKNITNTDLESENTHLICRGPDSKVSIIDNDNLLKYKFIFNRLSILDLSASANQPMISDFFQSILMFNGEIYNHKELRNDLVQKGVKFFTSHSDSEVVLNGLSFYGKDFIKELRGQFSISFLDIKKNKLIFARDRVGQKPLYISFKDNEITFSSNLKSVHDSLKNVNLDYESISEYLNFGVVGAPKTIFKEIIKLRHSEVIQVNLNNNSFDLKTFRYWDPINYENNKNFDTNEFFELFDNAVSLRSEADVPIGNFLSGGLDSTAIIKNQFKHNPEINTFSVHIKNSKYDESIWSNLVAKQFKTNHSFIQIDNDINLNKIQESINSLDEPYADPSIVPSYLISKEISQKYKVAISGDGGDELLGGYDRLHLSFRKSNSKFNFIRNFFDFYPAFLGSGANILSFSKNLSESYSSYLSDTKLVELLGFKISDQRKESFFELRSENSFKGLMDLDYNYYLPEQMMYKVDRTSMANSLEVRSPFVDHKLIEYIYSHNFPNKNGLYKKDVLKSYLIDDFGPNFVNRKKQGFVFDIENWIFNNKNYLNDFLITESNLNILNKSTFNKLNLYKSRINALRIWKIFILEEYLKSLN